ncbi:hypothetical protein DH2020_029732 [Rehmannia glutinosa]|uniref:Dicer-like protein n=1 Tax=Rehmannia glutinosa TaxID=99300 RepID=A0ABR0VMS2_REHGL
MEGGDTPTAQKNESLENEVCEAQLSVLPLYGDQSEQQSSEKTEKDPRKIARKYQIDLCKKALEENVIAYLGTGCGKTHIAVLLIYEMGHLFKRPQKNICIFLAPTVALVQQVLFLLYILQFGFVRIFYVEKMWVRYPNAKVIEESVDFKVGIHCGSSTGPCYDSQILLHYLSHCFINIEQIALLIFDECHYAQLDSNHPYAEIMKIFYKADIIKLPRIFGMTASPILGKGGSIGGVEALLRAKVYSVEDKDELEQFVTSPKVKIYYYDSVENGHSSPLMIYSRKLEEIMHQCMSTLQMNNLDQSNHRNTKKLLQRLHCNIIFCLENLGLWGALQTTELVEAEESCSDDNLCRKYLHYAASALTSDTKDGMKADMSCVEVLKEPLFSRKLLGLIGILSSFRLRPNMKCIIFVNRIVTARSLSYIIQNLLFLSSWKCGFLIGVHSGFMSRKNTDTILEKFRSGELNVLVATKVGEEGLDIQTCCLVIRGNQKELDLIEQFHINEVQMNEEISTRNSRVQISDFMERTYKVDITGATISSVTSVSLLYHYCSKLPHDEFFNPKPELFYYDDVDGTVCNIILPANAPIHQIVSAPQSSIVAAKRDACLKACQALHEVGALTDYLLPEQDDTYEESTQDLSDSDSRDDEESREELHEMLVPAAFRKPWTEMGNTTCLSSYYIEFNPNPADRKYRKFGLFVKEPLPEEGGKMKLDLSLGRGRMVMTQLIPSGVARFDKDEIASAEKFQQMFLKVILDRHKFIPEYVSLEDSDVLGSSSSTFYLLLPVIAHERDKISVDWTLINRCLSSPIFRHPRISTSDEISQLNNHLHLANGCSSVHDILNSLVYVGCKDTFYFISEILPEKNGYSSYNDSRNHVEHYTEAYDIHLAYPDQPILKAKQLFVLDNLLRKKKQSDVDVCKLTNWYQLLELAVGTRHILRYMVAAHWKRQVSYSGSCKWYLSFISVALHLDSLRVVKWAMGIRFDVIRTSPAFSQLRLANLSGTLWRAGLAPASNFVRDRRYAYIGSSLFLLPSIMHRLESLLVALELKGKFIASFPEGAEVTTDRILEAITTERCSEHFSYERLEVLGDAFLKFAVGRHLFLTHDTLDEGQLTRRRSNIVNNYNLLKLATRNNVQMNVNALENLLGYKFAHKGLLIQAFVHPSFNKHLGGCYQRLEFLGDAVLDYLITSYMFTLYPKMKPGHLTDLRSMSVNNVSFADVARRWSFHKFIICDSSDLRESMARYVNDIGNSESLKGHNEEKTCPKALGDLVESCMGALFLDMGSDLSSVWKIMLSLLDPSVSFSKMQCNPLRELTELCQSYNWDLQFSALKKNGKFSVEASVIDNNVSATAEATDVSGKTAKRMAARKVLECLKAQGYRSKSKSLEEVIKESEKGVAKLIGYDETPVQELLKLIWWKPIRQPHFLHEASESLNAHSSNIGSPANHLNSAQNAISHGKGSLGTGSAKSHLYEICAANFWKPPVFDCCQETGPSHLRE